MNVLERIAKEKRDTVVVGIARWHIKGVGQEDYSRAHEGTFVLLAPYITKENADVNELTDDDPRKLDELVKLTTSMKEDERAKLAALQRSTASAGIDGVSEADEECQIAKALHAEAENAAAIAMMKTAEDDYEVAKTEDAIAAARALYRQGFEADRRYVGAQHRCDRKCFKSYRPIKWVPREEDERPSENLLHINTIPPPTITLLFREIMALSDEGGRARRRITAFQRGTTPNAGRARTPVRETPDGAPEGSEPRRPEP